MPNDDVAVIQEAIARAAKIAVETSLAEGSSVGQQVVRSFVSFSPPENSKTLTRLITLKLTERPQGFSRKPGNILMNWRKLLDVTPDVTIAGVGAETAPPWVWPLIGLYVWNKLWRGAEETFSDIEASVMLALWKNRDSEDKISEEEGYLRANEIRTRSNLTTLTNSDYNRAINRLLSLDCIEMNNGIIWLRESVQLAY
jgi:hypothetical protein